MKRIAAPMVGGMLSSTVLTVVVIPAVYSLWREREVRAARTGENGQLSEALGVSGSLVFADADARLS